METSETFIARVAKVQQELKAPKGQYNNFGKYSYRSCEDILEAVKPHLEANGLALIIYDELECVGGRHYVKATASIYDAESMATMSATAYAREPESKKGMDESQITGCASSYARKYALNGLLLIDDTKDADSMDNREQKFDKRKAKADGTDAELRLAQARCKAALQAVSERDGFDPKPTWKDIQKRPDYENTPGFWTARAVEYECS